MGGNLGSFLQVKQPMELDESMKSRESMNEKDVRRISLFFIHLSLTLLYLIFLFIIK